MSPEPGPEGAGLVVRWLGCVPYGDALALQERAVAARRTGKVTDQLLLLEHPPVITLGSGSHDENIRVSESECAEKGIERFRVRRGGDVTFHAPGQLVGYLVMDLAERGSPDVHRFLRDIESALIEVLGSFDLRAHRIPGWTGVFMGPGRDNGGAPPRKIASIGVGLKGWVSYHGFALDVDMDLSGFDAIVPCGLAGVEMTSIQRECAEFISPPAVAPGLEHVRLEVSRVFSRRFGATC